MSKRARETAFTQSRHSEKLNSEVESYISDASNALEKLNKVLKIYERLETERELDIVELDYVKIKV